ncbi:MAG: outer membrane protein transport protein [Candidatus Zixiibacteriota bacterium]
MKTLVGLLTLSLMLTVSVVFGQSTSRALNANSFGFYGGGARAMAMGNAFIGLADDISGGSWNPAGIYQLDKPAISVSYNMFTPKGEYRYNRDEYLINEITPNDIQLNGIGHFSFVAPVRIKGHPWVFNLNFIRNNNSSFLRNMKTNPWSNLDPDDYLKSESGMRTFNFGFSTRLYDRLAIGVVANIYDAREIVVDIERWAYDSVIYFDGTSINVKHENGVTDSIASSGFNFLIGTMYKMDKVSLGAVIRTPFQLKHNSDRLFEFLTTHQGLVYTAGSDTLFDDNNLSKQDLPLSIGFGVGLTPKENIKITLDFNYDKYGSVSWFANDSTVISPGGERTDYYSEIPIDWNNTFGVGSGIEYVLTSAFGQIPIRAGFRFNQLPTPKDFNQHTDIILDMDGNDTGARNMLYTASGRQNMTQFSVGSGIHWSQIRIDLTYRISSQTGWNRVDTETDIDNPSQIKTISVQGNEPKSHEFNISFTGYF